MRIYKYRIFHQWAKKERVSDATLKKVIDELENGLFDANLGDSLYKKRIARKGKGKRESYRAILAFKVKNRSVFMYGFAKNDRGNISHKEVDVYKKLSNYFLEMPDNKIETLIKVGELFEVK